ncbi:MAG: SHOCT domain-containing protein [Burkholderiales bacterium]
MMWGYDEFGYGGGGMGIGMLLFWGLIIAAIVVLVRGFGGSSRGNAPRLPEKTTLDILPERYARGEIDKAEFEEKRRDLSAG